MKTVPLHPEHVDPLARTLYTEWRGFAPWSSMGKIHAYYETCLQGSGLPVALVAVDSQGRLFGSSALKWRDIATLPQYECWFSDIFMLPPYRGKDVGKLLVEHCLGAARKVCLLALYLYTPDVQTIYGKCSWREIEWRRHNGETVSVIKLDLWKRAV